MLRVFWRANILTSLLLFVFAGTVLNKIWAGCQIQGCVCI